MTLLAYVLALLTSSGLAIAVATWLWSQELDRAATVFATMLSLYPIAGMLVIAEVVAPSLELAVVFYSLHNAVAVVIVPLWCLFAVAYTGRDHLFTRPRLAAVAVVLLGFALVHATDPIHGLLWEYDLATEPFQYVTGTEQPLYAAYSLLQGSTYTLGMGLLAYHGLFEAPAKRKPTAALFVGFLPVLFITGAWMLGYVPGPLNGAINVASVWSLALVAWAVFRYQLFDILTLARKRVVADLRDPIIVLDESRDVVEVNEAATETFPALADAGGERIEDLLPWLVDEDGTFVSAFTYYDDGAREFAVSVSPLTTGQGTYGYGLVLRDVTSLNRQIRDLERQSEQLERFASTLSHDLRNPLNVASGRTQLALETGDTDHLEAAVDAHDRMTQIIEDTLALSREGRTIDEPERVRLAAVFEDAWASTETGDASVEIDPEADVVLSADATRFQNVFENLIRNSIEHGVGDDQLGTADGDGEPGSSDDADDAATAASDLTIMLGRHDDGFYVEDDGVGVPSDERERVFDHQHTTGSGTGLGLAIVEAIASAHGWSVTMEAGSDGGARVVFGDVDVVAEDKVVAQAEQD